MPRPDLKSLPITEWFKPRGVGKQLASGLRDYGIGIGNYNDKMNFWTRWLTYAGYVVRPYYANDNKMDMNLCERNAATIRLIGRLAPDQTFILPYDANILPEIDKWTLIKKGSVLKARHIQDSEIDLKQAIEDKLKTETLTNIVAGIDFEGVKYTSRMFKIFTLVDCIKANIMDEELPADAIKTRLYLSSSSSKLWEEGAMAHFEGVPSLSRHRSYDFGIKHIPVKPRGQMSPEIAREVASTSFDILSTSECELSDFFDIKYGRGGVLEERERKGDELFQSMHVIFAYHRVQKEIERKYPELEVINPYPRPGMNTEEFFWKLLHQVMTEKPNPDYDNYHRLPLGATKTDIELLLHKKLGYNNELRKRN
jgi:hypothetical protein